MIRFVVKWWSLRIWFRVGRTVRKYQAKDERQKKCNKLYRSDNRECWAQARWWIEFLRCIFSLSISLALSQSEYSQTVNSISVYARPQISEQFTVKSTLAHTCRQYSSAVSSVCCCERFAVPCFIFICFIASFALASSYYIVSENRMRRNGLNYSIYVMYGHECMVCWLRIGNEIRTPVDAACMYTTTVCYVWHGVAVTASQAKHEKNCFGIENRRTVDSFIHSSLFWAVAIVCRRRFARRKDYYLLVFLFVFRFLFPRIIYGKRSHIE